MEETLNMIREARPALRAKANRRAAERQLFEMRPAGLEENATDPEPKMGDDDNTMLKGGNEAGLRRLVGKGRAKKGKGKLEITHGGAKMLGQNPATYGKGKLQITHGDESSDSDEETGGARLAGRMLKEHIEKLHGGRYSKRFLRGMGIGPEIGAQLGRPNGIEVAHAVMVGPVGTRSRGGENLVPGAVAPVALGNAPQAPKSFARNSIGQSRAGATNPAASVHGSGAVAENKRQVRGRQIAQIMRERGCNLAEASRILKQMKDE
jgi:hypothetical protein